MTQGKTTQPHPAPAGPHAWDAHTLADPHAQPDKPGRVRAMFAAIAGSYDLNNRLHSLGLDQSWRRFAVKQAAVRPGDHVLDAACGTGDLTQLFGHSPAAKVLGLDFTQEMLDVADVKKTRLPDHIAAKITYIQADAQALPFPDQSFDVVSIAFGIRNVADPAAAISQFFRVLRPGGRLIVLEFDTPRHPPLSWINAWYCGSVMPRTATLISGDRSGAYRYLPRSVGTFLSRDALCEVISNAGFERVTTSSLTFGLTACYRAYKP